MTAAEFTAAGRTIGWRTQRDAAAALGLSTGAVAQYQTGKRAVPGAVAKRVRDMLPAGSSVAHESGYQKKKGARVSFTHFREQEYANDPEHLRHVGPVAIGADAMSDNIPPRRAPAVVAALTVQAPPLPFTWSSGMCRKEFVTKDGRVHYLSFREICTVTVIEYPPGYVPGPYDRPVHQPGPDP